MGGVLGCSRLSDAIRYIHSKEGNHLVTYIDDLMAGEFPEAAERSFSSLCTLLQRLNIPISQSKLVPPTKLGIEIDTIEQTLSIPVDKLNSIVELCEEICQMKSISKRKLQSVLGQLLFVHKAVKPARYFVNRLLFALRNMGNWCTVSEDMKCDLRWFIKFVKC